MNAKYPIDYFHTTYGLTMPHTDVVKVAELITPCTAFDLGCGQGRNSLFLSSLGFEMTSRDVNPRSIDFLKDVMAKEHITSIDAAEYDINTANITGMYDFIFSTVVFMFLQADRVPAIIENMQTHTRAGGYNLIVSAMDTEKYPCDQGFSFTFKEGELQDYYKDWEILQYNEEVGELHRLDKDGNRVKLQFATMLAQRTA
ncbi:tellurite resistance methyltransferase TehB [Wohlfahrtiimonas sp. G9077]|uniref:tellurite resistance methyltransferase TehB n=1 Tax=Wohlfahrtiimonas sp. G9077 TaxID=1980118 RepID=UPI000B984552|nr:tellurite resistance methyltransferase TehB [Wohlfahrtiimonas sp. G9077]OYQ75621.1 tellurite resistance methyltransferase TehB [Wohlfahrtiimonas sp. G9077]